MPDIKIITRKEWKAKQPRSVKYHLPRKITIHHQGGTEQYPKIAQQQMFKGAETIRAIQNFHMQSRKWQDIGYNALIVPNGDIYQGREFNVVGAHVQNNNTGNIGICVIGNFEIEKILPEQLSSLKKLIVYLASKFPSIKIPENIFYHKEFQNTDCPGKNLIPIIQDIRSKKISLYDI